MFDFVVIFPFLKVMLSPAWVIQSSILTYWSQLFLVYQFQIIFYQYFFLNDCTTIFHILFVRLGCSKAESSCKDQLRCIKISFWAFWWFRGQSICLRLPAMQETWVRFLGREDPLEKEMATHSSIETWVRFLGREDPLEKEMATHSSILTGESHGQRSLVGCSPRGRKESLNFI